MTAFFEFAGQHPSLTGFLAIVAGLTIVCTAEAFASALWRRPTKKKTS